MTWFPQNSLYVFFLCNFKHLVLLTSIHLSFPLINFHFFFLSSHITSSFILTLIFPFSHFPIFFRITIPLFLSSHSPCLSYSFFVHIHSIRFFSFSVISSLSYHISLYSCYASQLHYKFLIYFSLSHTLLLLFLIINKRYINKLL